MRTKASTSQMTRQTAVPASHPNLAVLRVLRIRGRGRAEEKGSAQEGVSCAMCLPVPLPPAVRPQCLN